MQKVVSCVKKTRCRLSKLPPEERRIRKTCNRLKAAARKIWGWDTERRAVLDESEKQAEPDKLKTQRTQRLCLSCKKRYHKKNVHADHVIPVGTAPTMFKGWDDYYARMFTTRDNIQPLCLSCHKTKTVIDVRGIRNAKSAT